MAPAASASFSSMPSCTAPLSAAGRERWALAALILMEIERDRRDELVVFITEVLKTTARMRRGPAATTVPAAMAAWTTRSSESS